MGENATFASVFWKFVGDINTTVIISKLISVAVTLVIMLIAMRIADKVTQSIFVIRKKTAVTTLQDAKRNRTMAKVTKSAVNTVIMVCGILLIFSYFVNVGALLTVAGVGTVAIGFGAKRIVEDLICGFFIVFQEQFYVGDYVEIEDDHYGVVENIGTMMTKVRLIDGSLFMIRNGEINHLVNHSRGLLSHGVDIDIAYGEDVARAIDVANRVCDEVYKSDDAEHFPERPQVGGVAQMDKDAVTIRVYVKSDAAHRVAAEAQMRQILMAAMATARIKAPKKKMIVEQNAAD